MYLVEIVAEVEIRTIDVLTVNDALLAPAGMSTLEGTLAAPLLLDRVTCTPPAGAGALRVTVPLEDCRPPTTLVGLSVSEVSVGSGKGVGFTVSDADRVTPPKVPMMVTAVDVKTGLVLTVNVALVAPAGTITLAGTRAAEVLLLDSATCAPPAGAGPLNVTVPVDEFPPTTLVGFNVNEEGVGAGEGTGVTVSEADTPTPPYAAEIATAVDALTTLVLTANVALVAPAATVTLAGVLATAVLLLDSITCAPPVGAGPLNVTVPVEEFPPTTLFGLSVSDERESEAALLGASSNSRMAGFGSLSEMPTNFDGEII